jgi:hypothetical protein
MRAAQLLAPRAFTKPARGERRWCEHCRMSLRVHRLMPCSQCGGEFKACLIGVRATGFSDCRDHGANGGWK